MIPLPRRTPFRGGFAVRLTFVQSTKTKWFAHLSAMGAAARSLVWLEGLLLILGRQKNAMSSLSTSVEY
jgi:hypothetical protein